MDELIGVLNICKVPGLSSHEVVARVRRIAGIKRVGHTGTLDPSACGVLPICLGRATRLAEYIAAGPKSYRAEFLFGVATESYDAEGQITDRQPAAHITEADILAVLPQLTGTIMQFPPALSAVQIGGRRAYDFVRRGEEVTLPHRQVTVHHFIPRRFIPGAQPRFLADISVSKGTYIRSLARDLGVLVGPGATLSFLARTQVGQCQLEEAVTLEELAEAGDITRYLQRADAGIDYIPALTIPDRLECYAHGTEVRYTGEPGLYRVYLGERFLGLGRVEGGWLRPAVNLQV